MNDNVDWGRPLEPNRVAIDIDTTQTRARVVREALRAVADAEEDRLASVSLTRVAEYASDETLAKLGRLLK